MYLQKTGTNNIVTGANGFLNDTTENLQLTDAYLSSNCNWIIDFPIG